MWIGIHRQSSAACLNPHAHTNRKQKNNERRIISDKHSITQTHSVTVALLSRRYDTHTAWQAG